MNRFLAAFIATRKARRDARFATDADDRRELRSEARRAQIELGAAAVALGYFGLKKAA